MSAIPQIMSVFVPKTFRKHFFQVTAILIANVALVSCAIQKDSQAFLPDPFNTKVSYHNMHGLFGGYELEVDKRGHALCRHVNNKRVETRVITQLSSEQLTGLDNQILTSGILEFRPVPREQAGCRVLIRIHVETETGAAKDAELLDPFDQWDKFPKFQRFNHYITELCEQLIAKRGPHTTTTRRRI